VIRARKKLPEDENDQSPTVSSWRDKPVYISSFLLSQRDIFESWKKVTGDKNKDWMIDYEPTGERYKRGLERLQKGGRKGETVILSASMAWPTPCLDYPRKIWMSALRSRRG
jgi:hypothetical protein